MTNLSIDDKLKFLLAICKKYGISYFLAYPNGKKYSVLTDVEIENACMVSPIHMLPPIALCTFKDIRLPFRNNIATPVKLTSEKIESFIGNHMSCSISFHLAIDLVSKILKYLEENAVYLYATNPISIDPSSRSNQMGVIPAKTDPFQFLIDSELSA